MKRRKRKLLSGVLTAALLLQTVMPTVAFATESAPKTIAGFSALEQTEYNLPIGADEAAVKDLLATFPDTITATVEYFVTEEVTQPPAPPVEDSGEPEQLPEEPAKPPVAEETPAPDETPAEDETTAADETSAEDETLAADELLEVFASGNSTGKLRAASDSNVPEKDEEPTVNDDDDEKDDTTLVEKKVTENVRLEVTWESGQKLTTEEVGEFIYTAKLTDEDKGRYNFANGVSLPELTVAVSAPMLMSLRGGKTVSVSDADKFRDAFETATDGDTIQVTAPIDLATQGVTLSGNKSVTLNLNNNEVTFSGETGNHAISLSGGASLTITDNLDEKSGKLKSTRTGTAISSGSGCTVTVSGGTVSATAEGTAINNSGTVTVSGGEVSATDGMSKAIRTASGKVTISGGTVAGESTAIYIASGTVEISGGTVAGGSMAIDNHGTVTISGGTVLATSNGSLAIQNDGTVTVAKGLIFGNCYGAGGLAWTCTGEMTLPIDVVIPKGKTFIVKDGATLTIPGGVTFTNNGIIKNLGTINGTVTGNQPQSAATVAEVTAPGSTTSTPYDTLVDAFTAAPRDSTVKLLKSIDLLSAGISYSEKALTLDLNGQTVTYSGDNAAISLSGGASIIITDNAAAENGAVKSTGAGTAISSDGSGKITVSGKTTVTSANARNTQGTIYFESVPAEAAIVLEVSGGTVSNTASPEGYSVYFNSDTVSTTNLAAYYTKAEGAAVGKVKPGGTPAATPNAIFTATGTNGGTLTGLTANTSYKYSADGGSNYISLPFTGTTANIPDGITAQNGIKLIKNGDGINTGDSLPQNITVTQADVPTNLGKADATAANNDGKITNVSSAMEYRKNTDTNYTPIEGTAVTGLAGGVYCVRVKAGGAMLASADILLLIQTSGQAYIFDLSQGGVVIENGSLSGTHKVTQATSPETVVDNIPEDAMLIITGTTTDNLLKVNGGTHSITLSNVDIEAYVGDVSDVGACAFEITGGASVTLTMEGTNQLQSGNHKAGLQVEAGNSLTIKGTSNDSLTAIGTLGGAGIGGAGIDGGKGSAGGSITITGGTVTAISTLGGAGIGGGAACAGGSITITGGTVTTTSYKGAGIGNGSGATEATSFTTGIDGNAFIKTSRITDNRYQTAPATQGVIFVANAGTVYGSPMLATNATIASSDILTVPSNAVLTIPGGITLTNNGRILNLGTITGNVSGTQPESMVAEVTAPDGTATPYATLDDALDAAVEGSTVKLFADVLYGRNGASVSQNTLTLDLNGKTLSTDSYITLNYFGTGTLTLQDSGTGGRLENAYFGGAAIQNAKTGTMNITGGTVKTDGGANAVVNNNGGTVNYTGGIILGDCFGTFPVDMAWSVKGNQTLAMDLTLSEETTFTILSGAALTIAQGKTVTNNGTIHAYGMLNYGGAYGTITGSGNIYNGSAATLEMVYDGAAHETASYGDTITFKVSAQMAGAAPHFLQRGGSPDQATFYQGTDSTGTKLGEVNVTYDSDTKTATAELPVTLKTVTDGVNWDITGTASKDIYVEFGGSTAGKLLDSTASGAFSVARAPSPAVSITGTPKFGQILTVSFTAPTDGGAASYTWQRGSSDIAGATASTYTLTADDVGKNITATVTFEKNYGAGTSAAVAVDKADAPAAPTNGVVNDVKGTDNFGFTVVDSITDATQYEYSLNSGTSWTDVAANPILIGNIPVSVGALQVRVKETGTRKAGEILSNAAAFTASIEGNVGIDGTAAYGETLTAEPTGTQSNVALSYEWKSGETVLQKKSTNNTYTIPGSAVGKTITVEVTAEGYNGLLTATATVGKKAVTATAFTISKVYDGTSAVETADQALTITKVNSGDDITVTMPSAAYIDATASTGKAITIGALTITGSARDWYDVTAPSGVTGEITTKLLATSMISGIDASYSYTGIAITPTPTVADGDPSMISANDYTVSYEANTNTGTAKVILTGKGNYSGTVEKTFTIAPKAITPTMAIAAVTYDGTAKEPALTVKDGSTTLAASDYTAAYSDNINAGVSTGKVAVTLKGNYSGSANATFTINKANGLTATTPNNLLMIKGQETEYTFDLSTIALSKNDAGTKTYALGALTNSNSIFKTAPSITGDIMSFTSNINTKAAANQATQVVKISSQNYEDTTVTLTFDIAEKTHVTITGLTAATSLVYNGSAQNGYTGTAQFAPSWTGTLTYTYYEGTGTDGTKLNHVPESAGTYTMMASIPDSDLAMAGSHAPITFTIGAKEITVAKGSYKVSKTYDGTTDAGTGSGELIATGILPADSGVSVTPGIIPAYSGSAVKSNYEIALPVSIGGDTDSNYTLAASTVAVPGEITKASITITIDVIAAADYTGSQIKPTVTVKGAGNPIADTNYTVEYGANVNAGENAGSATVKAKTTGNYSFADVTANFTINKAAGSAISGNVTGSYTGNGTNFTYTITHISGAEYKMDSGAWQDSNIFANIVPLSKHTFSARMKADANHLAGVEKAGDEVEFVKLSGVAAPTLVYTVSGKTGNKTITITAVDKVEYQFGTDAWSGTNAKTYLTDETVTIGIRIEATATHNEGAAATASVNLAEREQTAPAAFTLIYAANGEINYTVTIPEVSGCEYSFDGTTYNSSRTKTANTGDTVTGYMRKMETDSHNASPAVSASVTLPMFKVKSVTSNPNSTGFTSSTTVTLTSDTANAEIYYTTDGSTPSTSSTKYITAIQLTETTTVKAIAVKTGMIDSDVASFTFTKNSGGGGSSSGGSSSGSGSTSSTNPPTQGSVTVPPTVFGDTATVTVPEATVKDAITKAQAKAKKNGKTQNGISVEIKADTQNAANLSAGLPKSSIDALISAGVRETRITSGVVTISLNLDTLKEIQKQAGSDVTVTAVKVANTTLSAEVKALVGDRPVYNLNITCKDGSKVTSFGTGRVSVSIPYTLGANEAAGNVVACYIDSTGKVQEMANSVYNPDTKTLSFAVSHFSMYAVGYKTSAAAFSDITNHWTKDSIEFVAARGLLSDTGSGTFAPDTAMTRGMFVTALGRLAGVDTKKYENTKFIDVTADTYYAPYVAWANVSGIVNGTTDTTFSPDTSITREQMAVIMQNYARAIGFTLPKVHEENTFADNAKIGGSAKDAIKIMQMAGVLAGKSSNQFDPQGTATRAEVSAVLKRFVELSISTDSAQGWMKNDSGKWMFFENGRSVTGTKNIGGVSYTFNQNGETADLPKNQVYGSYPV